jgi:hypothetical protein
MPFEVGRKKTGGRARGVPNRASADFRDRILRSGVSPADFLTQVYRDETQPMSIRVDCARTLCAYVYPKVANVDINSHEGQPQVIQIIRFSADAVEPNKRLGAPIIDMTVADAGTEAVETVAEVVIEATSDGEEEC